jgi:hypothetical protein
LYKSEIIDRLHNIGNIVNKKNNKIIWGVGGSLLLNFHKLIDHPNDIDILVDENDAAHFNEIISPMAENKEVKLSNPFCTTYFSKYCMNNVDIDIMGGFAIQHNEGVYKLSLKEESIVDHRKINGVEVPLCALEDWYILYCLIPNKQEKVFLIENHFKTNGVKYSRLLEEALKQPLPFEVKDSVIKLLEKRFFLFPPN